MAGPSLLRARLPRWLIPGTGRHGPPQGGLTARSTPSSLLMTRSMCAFTVSRASLPEGGTVLSCNSNRSVSRTPWNGTRASS